MTALVLASELPGAGGRPRAGGGGRGRDRPPRATLRIAAPTARCSWSRSVASRARGPTMLAADGARELEARLREAGFEAAARGRLAWLRLAAEPAGREALGEALERRRVRPGRGRHASRRRCCAGGSTNALARRRRGRCCAPSCPRQRALAALAVGELRATGLRVRIASRGRRAGGGPAGARRDRAGRRRLAPSLRPAGRGLLGRRDRGPRQAARAASRPRPARRCRSVLGGVAGAGLRDAGAGGVRRRRDRQVAGAAGRRPGGALGGALDARRLRAAVRARHGCPAASPNPAHLDKDEYLERRRGGGGRGGAPQRRRRRTAADRVPGRATRSRRCGSGPRSAAELDAAGRLPTVRSTAHAEAEAVPRELRARRPAGRPTIAERRRLLGAARLPPGRGDAPRRRRGLRPAGRRGARRRALAARQLRLSLRRRAGGALGREPGPALGRAAGHLASPLRDRARPRPARRLRLAGGERGPLRLPAALLRGRPGTTASSTARRRARPRAMRATVGRSGGARRRRRRRRRACRRSSRRASATRSPRAAQRWNVSAALLAAQLMAESNFNPFAVSPAGAAGIAQFMPGDRGRLRARRPVRRRGGDRRPGAPDVRPAGAVRRPPRWRSPPTTPAPARSPPAAACPAIPETQAYVARILGLIDGAGARRRRSRGRLLEVRLVD